MTTQTLSSADMASLNCVEMAAALQSGRTSVESIVAHLKNRRLGDSLADSAQQLTPLYPLLGAYVGAVMNAQQTLHSERATGATLAPIRRAKGSRMVCVHPPCKVPASEGANAKSQWLLTATRASWRWIAEHVNEILAACDAADKADQAAIDIEAAKKEADKAAKKEAEAK